MTSVSLFARLAVAAALTACVAVAQTASPNFVPIGGEIDAAFDACPAAVGFQCPPQGKRRYREDGGRLFLAGSVGRIFISSRFLRASRTEGNGIPDFLQMPVFRLRSPALPRRA